MDIAQSKRLSERFRALETSLVSDVVTKLGWPHQVLSDAFRPVSPDIRMAGPVWCYKGTAVDPGAESGGAYLSDFIVDETLPEGAIGVVAADRPSNGAIFGGLLARELRHRGCEGVLIEGKVRDATEIAGIGFAAFSHAVTPQGNLGWRYTDMDCVISLPGNEGIAVEIEPGDFLVGDRDGALIIPRAIAEVVADKSETLAGIEGRITAAIEGGMSRKAAFETYPRFDHISRIARD